MYDPHIRIVELPKMVYAELLKSLQSDEMWYDQGERGIVLYVQDFCDGDTRKLIFKAAR